MPRKKIENKTEEQPAIDVTAVSAEITPVDPEIQVCETKFIWNFDPIQNYLTGVTEKYKNIIVTDDNVEDMQKTKREIVSLRTKLQKFERMGKEKLRKPTDDFVANIKKLYTIVADVELPLANQLQVYENERIATVKAQIKSEFEQKAQAAALSESYWKSFQQPDKWTNKTAIWSETVVDIDHEVSRLLSWQKADDDAAELRESRKMLAQSYIEIANAQYALASSLIADEIIDDTMLDLSAMEIKETIFNSAANLAEVERVAKLAAQRETQPPQSPPVLPNAPIDAYYGQSPMPPMPLSKGHRDVIITIRSVDIEKYYEVICAAMDAAIPYKYDVELGDD